MLNYNQETAGKAPFAPEDPQLTELQKHPMLLLVILYGVIIVLCLVTALSDLLISRQFTRTDIRSTVLLCTFSFTFITFYSIYATKRYWERQQQQRVLAYSQSARYLAEKQPIPYAGIPQFAGVSFYRQRGKAFAFIFVCTFIWPGLLCYSWPLPILTSLFISLAIALITSGLVLWLDLSRKNQPRQPYVETSESGILTKSGSIKSQVNWQEARLFSTYRGPRTFILFGKNIQYYELASADTLVRWQWQHKLAPNYVTRPAMKQETYDQWQEQLLGYVVARTGLPLHDLDAVEVPAQERRKRL